MVRQLKLNMKSSSVYVLEVVGTDEYGDEPENIPIVMFVWSETKKTLYEFKIAHKKYDFIHNELDNFRCIDSVSIVKRSFGDKQTAMDSIQQRVLLEVL
jgi:hypothetical protein